MSDLTQIYRQDVGEVITGEEVNSLVSEIIHTLQDDYGYLKPQPKSTAGNIQGDGVYNWEAHNVLEDLIKKRYYIKEECNTTNDATQQMIDDNTIGGIGELVNNMETYFSRL